MGDRIGPVWAIATKNGRAYITPEDITRALRRKRSGEALMDICIDVLEAIERHAAEDARLCAFVMARALRKRNGWAREMTKTPPRP